MIYLILLIFGLLMLLLSSFYLVNSWQQYREWKVPTIMVICFLVISIYGGIKFPSALHHRQTASDTPVSATSQSKLPTGEIQQMDQQAAQAKALHSKIIKALTQMFNDKVKVAYDDHSQTFNITPTDSELIKQFNQIASNNQYKQAWQKSDSWHQMANGLVKTDQNIQKAGNKVDETYTIKFNSPSDPNNPIITVKNGKVIQSFVPAN